MKECRTAEHRISNFEVERQRYHVYFDIRYSAVRYSLLFFLCLLAYSAANGQSYKYIPDTTSTKDPDKILAIIIQGNEKTSQDIILREMKLQVGGQFDPVEAEKDQYRIQNLGLFNRVELDLVPTSSGVILLVTVTEMWYIWPYPIIFRNDRDWSRISVGAGLLHTNFRGRAEVIDFSFWLGANPSVRLRYTNPWIFGDLRLYTSFSVFAQKKRNLTFSTIDSTVTENHIGFNWRIGKRFGHHIFLDGTIGYQVLSVSEALSDITLSDGNRDHLPSLGASFTFDKRDLWEYPHDGHYLSFWATKTGWFGNDVDYLRYGGDVRKYLPIGSTTLAFRAATDLSSGKIPVYDQVHLGFLERVRGHYYEQLSGEDRVLGSAEFRFPIRKIEYYNWGPFQTMGRYGSNLRFGINGAFFIDSGAVWFQDEKLDKSKFITGWGGGLHFFIPYALILRLEYAFNEDWDGQVIFDVNVSF